MADHGIKYRFISVVLALAVLTATTGYVVDVHYCKGEVQSLGLFTKAKSCDKQIESNQAELKRAELSAENHESSITTLPCCSNEMQFCALESITQIKILSYKPTLPPLRFELLHSDSEYLSHSIVYSAIDRTPPDLRLHLQYAVFLI